MSAAKLYYFKIWISLLALLMGGASVQASHRALLFNDNAMERILDMWPDFVENTNGQTRGMENPGERALLVPSALRSHLNKLLREQPTPVQFAEGFKILARDFYSTSGMTTFGSRLDTNHQVSAFQHILREEGRLPARFAWSSELATQPLSPAAGAGLYETIGVQWQGIDANPWLWMHGISTEGDWDAPNRGCLGDDLPVRQGVDKREVKQVLEICPDFDNSKVQGLMRGLESGWRFVGVHGVGSHGLRIFIQKLEERMARNPGVLTLEYVRNSRHGFAHGTMVGKVPDVVEGLVKYNVYIPINARRALEIEPDNIRQHYVEAGWEFLAPVRSLIEQGVKVVGEGEIGHPSPETYFDLLDVYVNRELAGDGYPPEDEGEAGQVYVPGEGVDRIVALKLFTVRSAEFLLAESKVGSLEIGKYADFAVIDKDYLSGADRKVRDNRVLMTVLAGETRFRNSDFNPVVRRGAPSIE